MDYSDYWVGVKIVGAMLLTAQSRPDMLETHFCAVRPGFCGRLNRRMIFTGNLNCQQLSSYQLRSSADLYVGWKRAVPRDAGQLSVNS